MVQERAKHCDICSFGTGYQFDDLEKGIRCWSNKKKGKNVEKRFE